jgi:hypothetical protein
MEHVTEERARRQAKYATDLIWHAGTFVIINAMLWFLDIVGGQGVNWAYWVTIFWGIALAFHALAYFVDGRRLEDHITQEILDADHEKTTSPS